MKGIRYENFASKPMTMADTDLDPARVSPSGDAQEHRRTHARNVLRLPYHERIWLKKIAQRRRRKGNGGKGITIMIATLNVRSMANRQRTRGRGFYGAEDDQHYVRPRD